MGPVLIVAGVGLVALAGAIALIFYISKGSARGRTRTAWLCVALFFAGLAAFVVFNLAVVNYRIPPAWIAALVVAVAIVVGLFVAIGRDVKWSRLRVVAMIGLLVLSTVAFTSVAMSNVGGGGWLQPLYANRVAQIGEANGFTALLPKDLDMPTDALPVEALTEPDAGLAVSYDDFRLQERKGTGASETQLEKLVASGERPMGPDSMRIPTGGTVTKTTVQGQPAVVVTYTTSAGNMPGKTKKFTTVILVFELKGVDVRMTSESGEKESSGEWVPYQNLSADDLVKIAETMEPVQ